MGYVRHMDHTLNMQVHKATKDESEELSQAFYEAANEHALKRLEDAFKDDLRSFVEYGVRGSTRHAAHYRNEIRKLIEKAAKLSEKSNGSQADTA